jgi:tetratricopeptide (TPR) repeat protein
LIAIVLAVGLLLSIGFVVGQDKNELAAKELAGKEPALEPVQNTVKGLPAVALGEDNWLNQGAALRAEGKYEEALQAFDNATAMNLPFNAHAWFDKGTVYWQLGKFPEAFQSFDKSIELNPNNSLPWYYKGIMSSDIMKYDVALQSIDKAIELNPNLDVAYYSKGVVLKALGRDSEAVAAFGKFAELLCDRFSTEHKLKSVNVTNTTSNMNPKILKALTPSTAENTNPVIGGAGSGAMS